MNLVYLGKIVNTHGLNGELRIISDFEKKKDVLKAGNKLYINGVEYNITSYRHHKIFDMVKFDKIDDINMAISLKNQLVYFNREDFNFKILEQDLIGYDVYNKSVYKGKVIDIIKNSKYSILVIDGIKKHMVPYIDEFIEQINLDDKKIFIKYIKGLDYED